MQARPFIKVNNGNIFRDVDGTTYVKTPKSATSSEGIFTNCVVLITNSKDLSRGDLVKKVKDVYCEVIDAAEIIQLQGDESLQEANKSIIRGDNETSSIIEDRD
jgi:hypothetical protein